MRPADIAVFALAPIGFGLLGFIEPCAIGSTLLFIKSTEGKSSKVKLVQVAAFTVSRALFVGLLGILAAVVGTLFIGIQKAIWLAMGILYVVIGVLYLTDRIGLFMRSIGPRIAPLASTRGSVALGALLGLNIPACAGPILVALLAASATGSASGYTIAHGFVSLALFGFALSLPLVVAVMFAGARRLLDWLAGLSRRIPLWTGVLFVVLGLWSIWFSLFVSIQ